MWVEWGLHKRPGFNDTFDSAHMRNWDADLRRGAKDALQEAIFAELMSVVKVRLCCCRDTEDRGTFIKKSYKDHVRSSLGRMI